MTPDENALVDAIRELFDERFAGVKQALADHKEEMLRSQGRHSKRLNGHDSQFMQQSTEINTRFSQQDARTDKSEKMLWVFGALATYTVFKDVPPAAWEFLRGLFS